MNLKSVILSEVNREGEINIKWHSLYMDSKKKRYRWTYLQNRKILTDLENEFMIAGGEDGKYEERQGV